MYLQVLSVVFDFEQNIKNNISKTVEGVKTASAANKLSVKLGLEVPIIRTVDQILKREITHVCDRYLKKNGTLFPGLCMWIIIHRSFRKGEAQGIKLAMEALKFCTYSGKGGVVALEDFLSRFNIVRNNITEAGGRTDDFNVTDAFEKEFKRIPEMRESVHRMESSKPESKRHQFKWQWETANSICPNLEASKINN